MSRSGAANREQTNGCAPSSAVSTALIGIPRQKGATASSKISHEVTDYAHNQRYVDRRLVCHSHLLRATDMPPKSKKKGKSTYKMCESLQESELIQKWQAQGFEDKAIMDLMGDFKKIAKDRAQTKAEIKKGIEVQGGGDDYIAKAEFAKHFAKRMKVKVADANKLFAQADTNRDGVVNIDEFIMLMAVIRKGSPEGKVGLAFKMFDTQCDGRLNRTEISVRRRGSNAHGVFCHGMAQSSLLSHGRLPPLQVMLSLMITIEDEAQKEKDIEAMLEKVLATADKNGDEKLTEDELTAAMKAEGFLELLGQNVQKTADAMLETGLSKKKSSICLVM